MQTAKYFNSLDEMTDAQKACRQLLADVFYGAHHLPGRMKPNGKNGVECIASSARLGSWDCNYLTRLIILAHDRCIRVDIEPCSPHYIRIFLHQRKREGFLHERHPTMEEAIEFIREFPFNHPSK